MWALKRCDKFIKEIKVQNITSIDFYQCKVKYLHTGRCLNVNYRHVLNLIVEILIIEHTIVCVV